jgi:hypothetical protein
MDNALKPLWAFGLLLIAKVWCDVGFLYLVFFSLVDAQFVVGDERMRLVMVDGVCVENDLKDRRW